MARAGADSTNNEVQLVVKSTKIAPLWSQDVFVHQSQLRSAGRQHFPDTRLAMNWFRYRTAQHQTSMPRIQTTQLDDGQSWKINSLQVQPTTLRQVQKLQTRRRNWERYSTVSTCNPHLEVKPTKCRQPVQDLVQRHLGDALIGKILLQHEGVYVGQTQQHTNRTFGPIKWQDKGRHLWRNSCERVKSSDKEPLGTTRAFVVLSQITSAAGSPVNMCRTEFVKPDVDEKRLQRTAPVRVADVATDAQTPNHGASAGHVLQKLAAATVVGRAAGAGVLVGLSADRQSCGIDVGPQRTDTHQRSPVTAHAGGHAALGRRQQRKHTELHFWRQLAEAQSAATWCRVIIHQFFCWHRHLRNSRLMLHWSHVCLPSANCNKHTHTHPFTGPFPGLPR